MTEPTTSAADEMVERVARAIAESDGENYDHMPIPGWYDAYRNNARAAIAALAPELNNADLTARAFALKVRDAKQAGKDAVPVEELDEVIAEPYRVVMK